MEEQKEGATTGEMSALVCESEQTLRDKVGNGLKMKGYHVKYAETATDALAAMRLRLFDVVVVDELFDAANPEANEVLMYLQGQNMATRRRFFVALTGRGFATADNMVAFSKSVNIVINTENIDETGELIRQAVADNAAFYHVFNETLVKVGKI
jgi:ActR/RegA family two-component response regulator